jgi:hypothetical protein
MTIRLVFPAIVLLGTLPIHAQDAKDTQAKAQRKAAEESLKKAEVAKVLPYESAEVVLFTSAPEAKAKAYVGYAQKAFDATQKVLKFDEKERLWPGKLTVYYLPERRDFTAMKRTLVPDSSDKRSNVLVRVRGPEPFALMGIDQGTKPTDAEIVAELGEAVAEAMLDHRAGVNPGTYDLPGWFRNGFGKAILLRVEGNTAKFTAHRNKVKLLFAKANLTKFKAMDSWAGTTTKDTETLNISLVEYFLFGMEPGKFDRFLTGLKPNEQGNLPTVAQALEGMELKPEDLDAGWKAWVAKLK